MLHKKNIDVYVTGSNSKLLSTDVMTEFRGRGDRIHIAPLAFSEYYPAHVDAAKNLAETVTVYLKQPTPPVKARWARKTMSAAV